MIVNSLDPRMETKGDARFGPQPSSGSALMRRCRLLQSRYRVENLKQERCGPWRPGQACVGSSLVDGHLTGLNFISPAAFAYAQEKVREKASNRDLTIDEFRLYNNMLSSMPMCFNLFADLRAAHAAGNSAAAEALRRTFPDAQMMEIEHLDVEMIPRPTSAYIDDKTAFDAAIRFRDASNRPGLVSIETKYTDHLAGNCASKQERKHALADELGLFTDEGRRYFADFGYDQVARNLLLTLAYARRHSCVTALNYVLSLRCDDEARQAVDGLRAHLASRFRDRIHWLPLEDAVARALDTAPMEIAQPLRRFRERYLDFSPLQAP